MPRKARKAVLPPQNSDSAQAKVADMKAAYWSVNTGVNIQSFFKALVNEAVRDAVDATQKSAERATTSAATDNKHSTAEK